MKVAFVVVSYNTKNLLRRCLSSIEESARCSRIPAQQITTVVVDNASQDGSAELVAAEFPDVRLIASTENVGFTRANNLALQALGFRVVSASSSA